MERVKKEHKDKIMEMIKQAGDPDNYVTSWNDKGISISKKKIEVKRGKKSRASGQRFEAKVRQNLEDMGWIVCRWSNNVEFEEER